MRSVHVRSGRRLRRPPPAPRDGREGFFFNGRWYSCDEIHQIAALRMDAFDRLPREVRDKLNRDGKL
jgi:hypothetical protein